MAHKSRLANSLVALVVLLGATVEATMLDVQDVDCSFINSPVIPVEIKWLPSADNDSLVLVGNYVSYPTGSESQHANMRLLLNGMTSSKTGNGVEFKLDLTCANFTFTVSNDKTKSFVSDARVDLKVPNKGHSSCQLSGIDSWSAIHGRHYECWNLESYPCKADGETIVNLVMADFEFEVGGDHEAHGQGSFTTVKQSCPN